MFKSIGRILLSDDASYNYKIIDDDFEDVIPAGWHNYHTFVENFIKIYERRNLNTVKNTALFLIYLKNFFYLSEKTFIIIIEKLMPEYKYEIDKYLLLL